MTNILIGALTVYIGIALAFWAGCRAAAVQSIAADVRAEGRTDIARWWIEVVVLWLCLAWPWPLLVGRRP